MQICQNLLKEKISKAARESKYLHKQRNESFSSETSHTRYTQGTTLGWNKKHYGVT